MSRISATSIQRTRPHSSGNVPFHKHIFLYPSCSLSLCYLDHRRPCLLHRALLAVNQQPLVGVHHDDPPSYVEEDPFQNAAEEFRDALEAVDSGLAPTVVRSVHRAEGRRT